MAHKKDQDNNSIYYHDEKIEPESQETVYCTESEMQAIEEHVEKYIGEITWVMHEIVSDNLHIDVLIVEPTPERNFYTLITLGMSALPMFVPEDSEISPYAELMICLPPDWVIKQTEENTDDEPADEKNYWPVRWLKMLARFPIDYKTWLGYGHSIPNGEHFANNTKLNGIILSPPLEEEEFFCLPLDNKDIYFWNLVPVYEEEMQLKLDNGADKLFELFDEYDISSVLDVNRQNVALGIEDKENVMPRYN